MSFTWWPVDSIENNIFGFSARYFSRKTELMTVYIQVFS